MGIDELQPGSAAFYRKRFESSVMGFHQMLPPPEVAARMCHPEAPPTHPKGPNTNFQYPTPMPFRFQEEALPTHNKRHEKARVEHPIYATSSSEIGKLTVEHTDLPLRWYGLEGDFTRTWDSALPFTLPKTRVSSGLNTALDHSDIHHTMDQGWSGNLGLTDFNVTNREYAKHVVRPTRKA
mmetsp:Transcript_26208/g.52531  ORF Transcript_26208/g.52531 Transcript_26208/m.52531 type:complete len:181 (-) Transcript_26208:504-1046(-)